MLAQLIAEAEGNGLWFPHDINELIWGSIAFVIVMALLVWKAGPPIRNAMTARTDRIQGELDAAAELRTDAEAERDRITTALADSDVEAARIVSEAHEAAKHATANIAARADADIVALRERAAADLDATRRQAVADLENEILRLSLGAAERVVERNLDDAAHQELIERYIAQVGATS